MTSSNVVETHISILLFVGDRVYKLRKAVRFGFLDFTDRAARQADCEREVALNRRLAPDVYLGVADLVLGGEPVEHMAVMKRLPQERALARLARDGAALDDCVTAVARVLASFHAGALRSPEISSAAEAKALGRVWESNFEELGPFVGTCLDPGHDERIKELARRYLQGRAPLFAARIASGRVCDGHGDLQAEDIFCLEDGPRILDCIEFDDSLRFGDVVADVSFLVMDLERLGRPDAASAFVEAYQEFAGDRFPPSLLDHYCAMRAYVRAEVACLRHAQGDERARREARRLHDLALGYLERARARLVVVGGLPGTGKSTLASQLAESQGWTLLRSDEVRKELFGSAGGESAQPPGYRQGLYEDDKTAATYRVLLERAGRALGLGESVVVDASWSAGARRQAAAALASRCAGDLGEICCTLDAGEASRRLSARMEAGRDPSDATPAVAAAMAAAFDPWPSATLVDTSVAPGDVASRALDLLGCTP